MAIDPAFAYLLPYVGTPQAAKPKKVRTRTSKPRKARKPRKIRIRKPRKIRVIRPKKIRVKKIRVRKPRVLRPHKPRRARRSRKAIAAQTGYRSGTGGMAPGFVVVY